MMNAECGMMNGDPEKKRFSSFFIIPHSAFIISLEAARTTP
jgi:hypothetical protein